MKYIDVIVIENCEFVYEFCCCVDSLVVMINVSMRFNDGGVLGFGVEIGILMDKLYVCGFCGF